MQPFQNKFPAVQLQGHGHITQWSVRQPVPGNSDQTSSQTGSSRAVLAQGCVLQPELFIRMQLSAKGALQLAGLGLAWLHSLDVPAGPHDLLYHIEPICTYK